jgi:hypothetical protein
LNLWIQFVQQTLPVFTLRKLVNDSVQIARMTPFTSFAKQNLAVSLDKTQVKD